MDYTFPWKGVRDVLLSARHEADTKAEDAAYRDNWTEYDDWHAAGEKLQDTYDCLARLTRDKGK